MAGLPPFVFTAALGDLRDGTTTRRSGERPSPIAATSAVSIAEICVGDAEPETVAERVRSWGVLVLDVPAAAAEPCGRAYRLYRERRKSESDRDAPLLPLPDFFIGAHAEIMGWPIATADEGRFRTYFPSVVLKTP